MRSIIHGWSMTTIAWNEIGSQWELWNNPRLEDVVFHSMNRRWLNYMDGRDVSWILFVFVVLRSCVGAWCLLSPPISLAISVQTNNLQAKANAKLKRQLAHNQQLTANIVAEVNSKQPVLAVSLNTAVNQAATLQNKRQPRGKPVSASYKQFLLSIAYSPVRGIVNIQRLMNVGVKRIHASLTATAMLLHTLQLGCHVWFLWKSISYPNHQSL